MLTPRFKERLGLKTVAILQQPLTPVVRVPGTVDFDPRHVAAVGTRLTGLVRGVARFEGDAVKRGDLLGTIDSPELGSAQASVLEFRAQHRAAELNLDRERDLAAQGLTTTREVEQAAATLEEYRSKLNAAEQRVSALGGTIPSKKGGRVIGVHELRAPLDGTVVERHVNAGQSVEGQLTAFRIADLDHLWIELAVFERTLPSIHKGDPVHLSPLTQADDPIAGQVAHVGEQVDPATRTAVVRIEVDNRARKLRPGQAVTATIRTSSAASAPVCVVPQSAITYVDGAPTVFVAETDLRLVATRVEIGNGDGQVREVLSGVSAGQSVVVEGVFALKSELFR
jgi:cobalt-zinc-cadmium efflux system membrane fusion protein